MVLQGIGDPQGGLGVSAAGVETLVAGTGPSQEKYVHGQTVRVSTLVGVF